MFKFFIMSDTDFNKDNIINPDYWSEKLQSVSKFGSQGDVKEFSEKRFKEVITEYFETYFKDVGVDDPTRVEVWEAIEDRIFCYLDDRHYQSTFDYVYNFSEEGFQFEDFGFESCFDFTTHYIWICFAIVWGITKYNESKEI